MCTSLRDILKIIYPIFTQYIFESILAIVNIYFISRLGKYAIAAFGTARYIEFIFTGSTTGALLFSYTTLLSQTYGSGNLKLFKEIFSKLYTISITFSLGVSSLIITFSPIILRLIYPSNIVDNLALKYLYGYVIGIPAIILFIQLLSALYSLGKTREASICWILSDIINIILDPILMFSLNLGILGAGLALSLSVYAVLPLMYYFLNKHVDVFNIDFKINKSIIQSLIHVGLFSYIERVIISILYTVYGSVIARYGIDIYVAYQLGLVIETFTYLPILAFRDVANILVGREVVRSRENTTKILNSIIVISIVLTSGLVLLIILLSPIFLPYFTNNVKIIKLTELYLILATLSDIGHAVTLAEIGAFQGIGRAMYSATLDIVCMFVSRIIPTLIFYILKMPIVFIWSLMIVDALARGSILYIAFRKLYWKVKIFI